MNALGGRLRLVVVTPGRGERRELESLAGAAFAGGATTVWVRERSMSDLDLRDALASIGAVARDHGAFVLVSGRADLALELGLEGVHLGHLDEAPGTVRARYGDRLRIGFSAHDPIDAAAVAASDYVTLSPVFPTPSKAGIRDALGVDRFAAGVATIEKPVVALGGIDSGRIEAVLRAGACGIAVMRAVTEASDPAAATRALRRRIDEVLA